MSFTLESRLLCFNVWRNHGGASTAQPTTSPELLTGSRLASLREFLHSMAKHVPPHLRGDLGNHVKWLLEAEAGDDTASRCMESS